MFITSESLGTYLFRFRNPIRVIKRILDHEYPFEVRLRSGAKYTIFGHSQIYILGKTGEYLTYNEVDGYLIVDYNNLNLSFYDSLENGAIYEVFRAEEYKALDVIGRVVIDVGANIGDTAIYFALNGADRVVSAEPHIRSFQSALKNIRVNGLESKVIPLNVALGSNETILKINQRQDVDGGSSLHLTKDGDEIHAMSLKHMVEEFKVSDGILKMDCEGCEYDCLMSSDADTLRSFHQILLEYHFGPKKISKKLESVGFQVSRLKKGYIGWNTRSTPHVMRTGTLLATLIA